LKKSIGKDTSVIQSIKRNSAFGNQNRYGTTHEAERVGMAQISDLKNILITGIPGIGKTTLIRKIADALRHIHPVGFYTAEIR
jgi:GTP1/Obg family GTP-binding protein